MGNKAKNVIVWLCLLIVMMTTGYGAIAKGDPDVAELSIFSSPNGPHAFITIKNISNKDLSIGLLSDISPRVTISIGTWSSVDPTSSQTSSASFSGSSSRSIHTGIIYNYEAYLINYTEQMNERYSLTVTITQSQLDEINNIIRNYDKWNLINNCTVFASKVWNSVISNKKHHLSPGILGINTPKALIKSIEKRQKDNYGYAYNKEVPYDYGLYHGNGKKAPVKFKIE